jgi:hypothetical protein
MAQRSAGHIRRYVSVWIVIAVAIAVGDGTTCSVGWACSACGTVSADVCRLDAEQAEEISARRRTREASLVI